MPSELLKCPFCGSKAEVSGYLVCCSNADCNISPYTTRQSSLEIAIKIWNTRTRPSEEPKKEEIMKPEYYYKGAHTEYKEGSDPEVTCWYCKKTFLCDPCDATCRLCGAPYSKERCKEFNFIPLPSLTTSEVDKTEEIEYTQKEIEALDLLLMGVCNSNERLIIIHRLEREGYRKGGSNG